MTRLSANSRRSLAAKPRRAIETLEAGKVRVRGGGHDVDRTVQRLRQRIAELEQ